MLFSILNICDVLADDITNSLMTLFYTSTDSALYYTLKYDMRTARHWADIAHNAIYDTNSKQADVLLKANRIICDYDINEIIENVKKAENYFATSNDSIAPLGQTLSALTRARLGTITNSDSTIYYFLLSERLANDNGLHKLLTLSRIYRASYLTEIGKLVEAADCARLILLNTPNYGYKDIVDYIANIQLYRIYSTMGIDDLAKQYNDVICRNKLYNNYIQFESLFLFQKADYLIDNGRLEEARPIVERLMQTTELIDSKIDTWKTNLLNFRLTEKLNDINQAHKYLNICKRDIAITRNRPIDVHYSPNLIPLGEAIIAIQEQKYLEAKKILDNMQLNPIMLNNLEICHTYHKCYELIYSGLGDYKKALEWLNKYECKYDSIQKSYMAQRSDDIETILHNDTTILNQRSIIIRKEVSISSKTTWTIVIGLFATILLLAILVARMRLKRIRHDEKTQKMLEQRNLLRANIAQKTKELYEQKELISNHNADILLSQSYAKRIQQGLLPSPERLNGSNIKETLIFYQSSKTISGDFYWFDKIDDLLVVCVADCSGHGIPGALMSTVALTILSDIIRQNKFTSPIDILNKLNSSILHTIPDIQGRDGIGMSVAIIDNKRHTIKISSAWQNIIIIDNGQFDIFRGTKRRLGETNELFSERKFEEQEFNITNGTRIYLYTDGVTNLISGKTKAKLKITGLKDLIDQSEEAEDGYRMQALRHAIVRWKGDGQFNDDFLLLGIEFKE